MVVDETENKVEIVFLNNPIEVYNEILYLDMIDLASKYFLLFIILQTEIHHIKSISRNTNHILNIFVDLYSFHLNALEIEFF